MSGLQKVSGPQVSKSSGSTGLGIRWGYVRASWMGRRISGVPSWAITAPSVNSTMECTTLCR